MEYRNGLMELFTKETGTKIKLKAKEPSGTPKETYTSATSKQIKHVDLEFTPM